VVQHNILFIWMKNILVRRFVIIFIKFYYSLLYGKLMYTVVLMYQIHVCEYLWYFSKGKHCRWDICLMLYNSSTCCRLTLGDHSFTWLVSFI